MKLQSKKTKLTHNVDAAALEKLKKSGAINKYIILRESPQPPIETQESGVHAVLVKEAIAMKKSGNVAKAKEIFTRAQGIKSTKFITKSLAEIETALASE